MNVTLPEMSLGQVSALRPARKPWLKTSWWTVVVVAATAIAFGYIYYTIFSLFQGYDDEGYVLISLKSFFQGKPLYDEVYSSFQPGFYVLHWLLFKVWGAPLCHDNIRLVTLFLWLSAAALNGLVTYRLTSSALLGLLVSIVSVRSLDPFANEPGHPQALACLLVGGVATLFAFDNSISPRIFALTAGCLVGMVLLIKMNVGLFILLPVTLLFASDRNGKIALGIKLASSVAMMGLPVVLWRTQLAAKDAPLWTLGWLELLALVLVGARLAAWRGRILIVAMAFIGCAAALLQVNSAALAALPVFSAGLLTLSIGGAVLMCLADSDGLGAPRAGWVWALLGGGLVLGSITLITLLRGTTFHGLADGLLWWPAKVSTSFRIRLRSNWLGACLGVAGATGCFAYLWLRGRWGNRIWFRKAIIASQLSFGVAVLAEFCLRVPGSSTLMPLHNDLPHFWMLPFAWLVAVPETGTEATRSARLALLTITVMQPLIACPVAGTQLVPASILILVAGAVCLGNGLCASLGSRTRTANSQWSLSALGAVGAVILLALFGRETLKLRQHYASLTPLNLPGASRIRLTADQVRVYHEVVAELSRPEVETFLSLPGLDSFYFWAQKAPPNSLNVSAWVILLDAEAQERIWSAAQSRAGLMVVRNRRLIRSWVGGRSVAQLPLVRHIEENFKTVSNCGDYELMVRR
jgi:hypothetical protein